MYFLLKKVFLCRMSGVIQHKHFQVSKIEQKVLQK